MLARRALLGGFSSSLPSSGRGYHGLQFVRPARGMPTANLATDLAWRNKNQAIPMTLEQVIKDYSDVLNNLEVRPGMENPFHQNPYFKPFYGMLNEKTKDEIYALHKKNPEFWTVRKLAHEYDADMRRIEAILVLKEAEKKMVQEGYKVDHEFTEKNEYMMGYMPYVTREQYWSHMRQKKIAEKEEKRRQGKLSPDELDEESRKISNESFDPSTTFFHAQKPWGEIAAKLKPLFEFVEETADLGSKGLFAEPKLRGKRYDSHLTNSEGKVLRHDDKDTNKKSTFVFLETGQRNKGEVYIREKSGVLRTGSTFEREEEQRMFGVWKDKNRSFYIRPISRKKIGAREPKSQEQQETPASE